VHYWDCDEFRDIVGVKLAQARFDGGDQARACLDDQQGFRRGLNPALPSVNRTYIVNDIDAGCELLANESIGDVSTFLRRARRGKGYDQASAGIFSHSLKMMIYSIGNLRSSHSARGQAYAP